MALTVSPITAPDVPRVAELLCAHLNSRLSVADWARSVTTPWKVDAPNHGFMLEAGQAVVGAYVAFYSEQRIGGRLEHLCNLGPWCVLPEYRFHGPRLLKALLAQPGYSFTDLSPSGSVVAINRRLEFEFLDTTTALVPNLPWPSWPGRTVISSDPAVLKSTLTGHDLELYGDHERARAARHVVVVQGDQHCYVVFRKDRRKRLPGLASFLHVGNPDLFRRAARPLSRHLLVRHRVLMSMAELRVVGHRPRPSLMLPKPRRKMFRSPHLAPHQIKYLYSELACVAW